MTGIIFAAYRSTNISTFVNFYSIYYFKKFREDIFYPLQISNAHFEAIKNQSIYNLNTVYNLKLYQNERHKR